MQEQTLRKLAKPMCIAAAFIWGSSFVVMKNTLDSVPVFWLLSIRFAIGAALLSILFWKKWKLFRPDYLWRGAIIGGFLFLAYAVQTYALIGTTPSKNAFLTAVYCVLVPFFYWFAAHHKPDRYNIIAAFLCLGGVGLVSLTGEFSITWGDGMTLLCAVFYASHIVAVAKVSPGKDIYLLTIFQFAFAALYSFFFALITQAPPMVMSGGAILSLLYLGIMATGVALLFQNVGQVHSDPASASVLLSLESVFGVLCSVLFYGDPVTVRLMMGFALIFVAIVCSETKFSFLRRKKAETQQKERI